MAWVGEGERGLTEFPNTYKEVTEELEPGSSQQCIAGRWNRKKSDAEQIRRPFPLGGQDWTGARVPSKAVPAPPLEIAKP